MENKQEKIIELLKKLVGRYGYTPHDIQNGIDYDEVCELLEQLEEEVTKLKK